MKRRQRKKKKKKKKGKRKRKKKKKISTHPIRMGRPFILFPTTPLPSSLTTSHGEAKGMKDNHVKNVAQKPKKKEKKRKKKKKGRN